MPHAKTGPPRATLRAQPAFSVVWQNCKSLQTQRKLSVVGATLCNCLLKRRNSQFELWLTPFSSLCPPSTNSYPRYTYQHASALTTWTTSARVIDPSTSFVLPCRRTPKHGTITPPIPWVSINNGFEPLNNLLSLYQSHQSLLTVEIRPEAGLNGQYIYGNTSEKVLRLAGTKRIPPHRLPTGQEPKIKCTLHVATNHAPKTSRLLFRFSFLS